MQKLINNGTACALSCFSGQVPDSTNTTCLSL
jgi:hypothetical protein